MVKGKEDFSQQTEQIKQMKTQLRMTYEKSFTPDGTD